MSMYSNKLEPSDLNNNIVHMKTVNNYILYNELVAASQHQGRPWRHLCALPPQLQINTPNFWMMQRTLHYSYSVYTQGDKVAQFVQRQTLDPLTRGSNPARSTQKT